MALLVIPSEVEANPSVLVTDRPKFAGTNGLASGLNVNFEPISSTLSMPPPASKPFCSTTTAPVLESLSTKDVGMMAPTCPACIDSDILRGQRFQDGCCCGGAE